MILEINFLIGILIIVKKVNIKITAIIIREEGIYYEVEGEGWEDEFSEETIKTTYYENSNTRTSN
jgi:hypothetical protein